MRIIEFQSFIREMPYLQQSFDVRKTVWGKEMSQKEVINRIFGTNEIISISRADLFQREISMDEFIIRVLMWGYPTKGRGKNIENLLMPKNFNQLVSHLQSIRGKDHLDFIEFNKLVKGLFQIKGLRLSTISKFLYFMQLRIEKYPALILDLKIITSLNSGRFADDELQQFSNLKYNNAQRRYIDYLKAMEELSRKMQTISDKIEMFLFEFGSNMKEQGGE